MPVKQLSRESPALSEGSFPRAAGDRAVESAARRSAASVSVCLLTGGDDRPYALGMASALAGQGISVDFIGSDKLDAPELHNSPQINFLNLRGDQSEDAPLRRKIVRILAYYARLAKYAARSEARIFHILWNNKFEHFDRTLLMLYYRLLSLGIQYRLCDHILVHTGAMKDELVADFGIASQRVSVIPFGINNTSPSTAIGRREARKRINLGSGEKTLLFFGQIAPYKGLEYLIAAMSELAMEEKNFRLVIAGRIKPGYVSYWNAVEREISRAGLENCIIQHIRFIPETEVEVYFKAADVAVIPYVEIFQSGVPFLAYSFGLPVIATDVGSLRQDIVEGRTGFICRAKDSSDLANMIYQYFDSELFRDLEIRREEIKRYANERYAWEKVAEITQKVYEKLSGEGLAGKSTGPSI